MMRAALLLPMTVLLFSCNRGEAELDEDEEEPSLNLGYADEEDDNADNVAPTTTDDAVTTWQWRQTEIPVLANDSDANGDSLDITEVSEPEHASVTIYESILLLTQTDDFLGEETLTYTADDGNGGTAVGMVTVTYITEPIIIITAPVDGQVIDGDEVDITFEVSGCDIDSPSTDPTACHLHKYLDEAQYSDADGTGFGHYDSGGFTISPVAEGEHTFSLWLVPNDGSDQPFIPSITGSVSFTMIAAEEEEKDTGGDDTGGSDTGGSDTGKSQK